MSVSIVINATYKNNVTNMVAGLYESKNIECIHTLDINKVSELFSKIYNFKGNAKHFTIITEVSSGSSIINTLLNRSVTTHHNINEVETRVENIVYSVNKLSKALDL